MPDPLTPAAARAELDRLERDAAILLLCEWGRKYLKEGRRDGCGHCGGCLGATDLAQQWLEEDGRAEAVMGAIANDGDGPDA